MKQQIKQNLIRLLWLLPVCFVLVAVILYQNGVYNISFLSRPEDTTSPETTPFAPDTTAPSDDGGTTAPPTQTTPPHADPTPDDTLDYDQVISSYLTYSDAIAQKYTVTGKDYTSDTVLVRLDTAINFPSEYALPSGQRVLSSYLGKILYHTEQTVALIDQSGKIALSGMEKFTLPYLRDSAGNPLFLYNGTYYVLNEKDKTMTDVAFDLAFAPPIVFNSPADYGRSDSDIRVFAIDRPSTVYLDAEGNDITQELLPLLAQIQAEIDREREWREEYFYQLLSKDEATIYDYYEYLLWSPPTVSEAAIRYHITLPVYTEEIRHEYRYGYLNADNSVLLEAQFLYASPFSENGLAMVVNEDGVAYFINEAGEEEINPYEKIIYLPGRGTRPAVDGYYLPENVDISKLGMFYFDHGLIRIHRRIYDYYTRDELLRADDVLMWESGKLFEIPAQYTLVAYSDGVLLLEKDGYYGYYDYTGKWIYDPVLSSAEPFSEGLAVIRGENGKKGVIDTNGNFVLPLIFDEIENGTDGLLLCYERNHGWSVFYKMEK